MINAPSYLGRIHSTITAYRHFLARSITSCHHTKQKIRPDPDDILTFDRGRLGDRNCIVGPMLYLMIQHTPGSAPEFFRILPLSHQIREVHEPAGIVFVYNIHPGRVFDIDFRIGFCPQNIFSLRLGRRWKLYSIIKIIENRQRQDIPSHF